MTLFRTLTFTLFAFFANAVQAGNLDAETVGRFVDSFDATVTYSEQTDLDKRAEDARVVDGIIEDGFSNPFETMLAWTREEAPEDHKQLTRIAKDHGFSVEEWGSTGDCVFETFLAFQLADSEMAELLTTFSPEMIELMPPEQKAMFTSLQDAMARAAAVPETNKQALEPHLERLQAIFERQAASAG